MLQNFAESLSFTTSSSVQSRFTEWRNDQGRLAFDNSFYLSLARISQVTILSFLLQMFLRSSFLSFFPLPEGMELSLLSSAPPTILMVLPRDSLIITSAGMHIQLMVSLLSTILPLLLQCSLFGLHCLEMFCLFLFVFLLILFLVLLRFLFTREQLLLLLEQGKGYLQAVGSINDLLSSIHSPLFLLSI